MENQVEFISIKEAAGQGITRLRLPQWADPLDHIKLDLMAGGHGPFMHLYGPTNQAFNGRDPVSVLMSTFDVTDKKWLVYTGPLPESDEYKAKVIEFNEYFK